VSENAFDSASQREQIEVVTGGCIELETEWKLTDGQGRPIDSLDLAD